MTRRDQYMTNLEMLTNTCKLNKEEGKIHLRILIQMIYLEIYSQVAGYRQSLPIFLLKWLKVGREEEGECIWEAIHSQVCLVEWVEWAQGLVFHSLAWVQVELLPLFRQVVQEEEGRTKRTETEENMSKMVVMADNEVPNVDSVRNQKYMTWVT